MTSTNDAPERDNPERQEPPLDQICWFLRDLVRLANDGLGLAVTLYVEGSVITGVLMSGTDYFAYFSEQYAAASTEDDDLSDLLRKAMDCYKTVYADAKGPDLDWPPQYIHLKSACYISSRGPMPVGRDLVWRGRLSSVGGYSLGLMPVARREEDVRPGWRR
ncbi:hypothetical protein [Falsirhodobacter sp. 1013]|uniref:hypothetical protein n=1 Tax=Falsirhodobacter sp. 1013 TaxID=3417566 RepID=UPI003EC0096F